MTTIAPADYANEWVRWYACKRKVAYGTETEAVRAARRRSGTHTTLDVYACRWRSPGTGARSRDHWHLTRRRG